MFLIRHIDDVRKPYLKLLKPPDITQELKNIITVTRYIYAGDILYLERKKNCLSSCNIFNDYII